MSHEGVQALIFVRWPLPFAAVSAFVFSLGITATPSAIPVICLLTVFLLSSQIFLPKPLGVLRITGVSLASSLGLSLSHAQTAMSALSSPVASLTVSVLVMIITTTLALTAIYADRLFRRSPVGFPAVWATLWAFIASVNPAGRLLTTWTPVFGMNGYKWLVPFFGQSAGDWITASWATVIAFGIGEWVVGETPDELVDDDTARVTHRQHTRRQVGLLSAFLVVLSIPSLFTEDLPLPVISPTTTSISVGCILPNTHLSPTLDDYIAETRKYQNQADILLWPETAVKFNNPGDRDDGLARIQRELDQSYVGVGFEDHEYTSDGVRGIRQNGFALLSNHSLHQPRIYYKQHLVPIAESFSLSPSTHPAEIYDVEFKKRGVRHQSYTLPLTASICLDFASPSLFLNLKSRPALILGPARTWDTSIAATMWQQALARATEINSAVLWCDGGKGGVSGIAGAGHSEIAHVGPGSWVASVAIQLPVDAQRTLYARGGGWIMLGFAWFLVWSPSLLPWLWQGSGAIRRMLPNVSDPGRPKITVENLIDAD